MVLQQQQQQQHKKMNAPEVDDNDVEEPCHVLLLQLDNNMITF